MHSLAHLDALSKEIWTFGVGWLHEFILVLSSTLSCFCTEIWTLGIGCLHDFYTCAQSLSHRQEVNLKTFNISFYIYLKFKDCPVINLQGIIYFLYLYVTCGNDQKGAEKV